MGIKGVSKYEGMFYAGQIINHLKIKTGLIILDREAKIEIICECGNEKIVPILPVLKNRIISCGCKMNKSGKNHYAYNGFVGVHKSFKSGAEQRGIEFLLSVSDLENLYYKQHKRCALSGIKLKVKECSLDRIDSDLPYTVDNVQIVCKHINMMKQDFNQDYFIFLCNRISELHRRESYNSTRKKRIQHQWQYELKFDNGIVKTFTSQTLRDFVKQHNESFTGLSRKLHISLHTLIRGKVGTKTGPCQIISKNKI